MMKNQLEIERKYIIKMPDFKELSLQKDYTADSITQIYLSSENATHRVRRRSGDGGTVYTENIKIRVDSMSAIEKEREITEAEFLTLVSDQKPGTRAIEKVRHCFEFENQIFEIDVYPQWHKTAIMETELDSREKTVAMPPFIHVVREVTGIREYSNAAMSYSFPPEDEI